MTGTAGGRAEREELSDDEATPFISLTKRAATALKPQGRFDR